jgi:hypothetical protein
MFLASCTAQVTVFSAKDKGFNLFVWTAQETLNLICSSYLQALDVHFCFLEVGIMAVKIAGFKESGFIPEKISAVNISLPSSYERW